MFHRYVPTLVLRSTQSEPLSNLPPWKNRLGFIPAHVVDKTLSATMQMVDTSGDLGTYVRSFGLAITGTESGALRK
jgi:hypothetical protein